MGISPNEGKAIAEYVQKHGLRLALSIPPNQMTFIKPDDTELVVTMTHIMRDCGYKLNPSTGRWSKPKVKEES